MPQDEVTTIELRHINEKLDRQQQAIDKLADIVADLRDVNRRITDMERKVWRIALTVASIAGVLGLAGGKFF